MIISLPGNYPLPDNYLIPGKYPIATQHPIISRYLLIPKIGQNIFFVGTFLQSMLNSLIANIMLVGIFIFVTHWHNYIYLTFSNNISSDILSRASCCLGELRVIRVGLIPANASRWSACCVIMRF